MREKINYALIKSAQTNTDRQQMLIKEIERVGYASITDALLFVNDGGYFVLRYLQQQQTIKNNNPDTRADTFKLKCITDVWGKKLKLGDKIVRSVQNRPRDTDGRKLTGKAIKDLQRQGTFDALYVDRREFKVDKNGCISCYFTDAIYFLKEFGINDEDGQPLTGRPEFSLTNNGEPQKHYWRFHEVYPAKKSLPVESNKE